MVDVRHGGQVTGAQTGNGTVPAACGDPHRADASVKFSTLAIGSISSSARSARNGPVVLGSPPQFPKNFLGSPPAQKFLGPLLRSPTQKFFYI